jgi:NAD(P) transhydrogenase subunit alpha
MCVNLAVLRETLPEERRVALVPEITAKLVKLGAKLHMETGAGDACGFPDSANRDVVFMQDRAKLVAAADVVMAVHPPGVELADTMQAGSILICFDVRGLGVAAA